MSPSNADRGDKCKNSNKRAKRKKCKGSDVEDGIVGELMTITTVAESRGNSGGGRLHLGPIEKKKPATSECF